MNTNIPLKFVLALFALAILAGWGIVGDWNRVHAQTQSSTAQGQCYEIPWDTTLNGRAVLINKCSGETWRFACPPGSKISGEIFVDCSTDYEWIYLPRRR